MADDGIFSGNLIRARFSGNSHRRSIRFDDYEIFYEFEGDVRPGDVTDADAVVISLIFYAMGKNRPLHVEGAVSSLLLDNIEEFQRAWSLFRPDLFTPVSVTADEEIPEQIRSNSAILAYSGGVDANSSLVWQLHNSGRLKRDIEAAVMAQGLDAKLSENMNPAFQAARESLAKFDIPLTTVRTNWRDVVKNWEMTFIGGIGSILHQFDTGYCLISSDEDYGSLVLPWSSNPITNSMLSGKRRLQTEGGGYTRCEKVLMIANHPEIAERLRVCWEAYTPERPNCGHCEKCIRTKMNFAVWGLRSPDSLGGQISVRDASRRLAWNQVQLNYLTEIYKTARENQIDKPWVRALRFGMLKSAAAIGAKNRVKRMIGR